MHDGINTYYCPSVTSLVVKALPSDVVCMIGFIHSPHEQKPQIDGVLSLAFSMVQEVLIQGIYACVQNFFRARGKNPRQAHQLGYIEKQITLPAPHPWE